jgi:hypothetical protein
MTFSFLKELAPPQPITPLTPQNTDPFKQPITPVKTIPKTPTLNQKLNTFIPPQLSAAQHEAALQWLTAKYEDVQFELSIGSRNYIRTLFTSYYENNSDINRLKSMSELESTLKTSGYQKYINTGDTEGLIKYNGKFLGNECYLVILSEWNGENFIVTQARCDVLKKVYGLEFDASDANRKLASKQIKNGILCSIVDDATLTTTYDMCVDLADNSLWVGYSVASLSKLDTVDSQLRRPQMNVPNTKLKKLFFSVTNSLQELLAELTHTHNYEPLFRYLEIDNHETFSRTMNKTAREKAALYAKQKKARQAKTITPAKPRRTKTVKENTMPSIFQTLLEAEEEHKSRLPSAASDNDEPEDDIDIEDEEDSPEDIDPDVIDNLKRYAGDMGGDLYSITVYNTEDDFAGIQQINDVVGALEDLNSPVVTKYLDQSDYDIDNNKVITAIIYNDRNQKCFVFNAAKDGGGVEPGISELLSNDMIDDDQANILKKIERTGKRYTDLLKRVDWRSGEAPAGRGAEALLGALSTLKNDLHLREFMNRNYRNIKISPEQKKHNAESSARVRDSVMAKLAARRAAKAQK